MKGLIYKDTMIFYRSIDKRMILIAGGTIALLMFNGGIYSGLVASIMLAMTTGMQNVICFASDEKAGWKEYQMAMPVDAACAVTSKYLAALCTMTLSLAGSLLLNLISSVVYQSFDAVIWGVSAALTVIIPLAWCGIFLPLTYWFGYQAAQTMGLFAVIPMVYVVKYFEDGAGFSAMTDSLFSCIAAAGGASVLLFLLSIAVSAAGYRRRK